MGIGVFALATGAMAAGDLIGSGIGLIALGKIFAIDAKVKFLAHRLRR